MALPRCYNFHAFDMATKFAWVNGHPGMGAVEPVSQGLTSLSTGLGVTRDQTDQGSRDLSVSWRGPAADAARESLAATTQGIDGTATVTENASARLTDYGHSFEAMRRQITYVNPDDYGWWQKVGDWSGELWHTLGGSGSDHVTIAERNQANDEVANRALQAHSVETSAVDDRFGTATAPPPPAAPGPSVGGGAGNAPVGDVPSAPGSIAGSETVGSAGLGGPTPGPGTVAPPALALGAPSAPGTPNPPGGPGVPPPGPAPAPVAIGANGPAGSGPAGTQPGGAGRSTGVAKAPETPSPRPPPGAGGVPTGPGVVGVPDRASGGPTSLVPDRALVRGRGGRETPGRGATGPGVRDRGTDFSNRLREQPPFSRTVPTSPPVTGPGAGRGPGSVLGGGRGFGGGPGGLGSGGSGEPYGGSGTGGRGSSAGGPGTGGGTWGTEPRTPGGRGGTAAESWSATRPGERGVGGYGPMMGGAGAMRDGQEHRNRYVVPTDEVFDVRVEATDAVLGPEEDDRR